VGAASNIPFGGFGQGVVVEPLGGLLSRRKNRSGIFGRVPRLFFDDADWAIKGRLFNFADSQGSSPVVIISQSFAREFGRMKIPLDDKFDLASNRPSPQLSA